tara:strand:+ start:1661 stop:1837 length:177 start_codon:yes stop_codon:yes gene_type:complete
MHPETDISAFILTYLVFEEKAKEPSKQSKMQQKSEDVGREVSKRRGARAEEEDVCKKR